MSSGSRPWLSDVFLVRNSAIQSNGETCKNEIYIIPHRTNCFLDTRYAHGSAGVSFEVTVLVEGDPLQTDDATQSRGRFSFQKPLYQVPGRY